MRPPFDGWVDERSARPAQPGENVDDHRDVEAVRQEIALFRGSILSEAYALEGALDTLIVWHLFRDRQDGMAAFFEDTILRENSFGLDRKCRLCRKIAEHWAEDEEAAKSLSTLLDKAKQYRNRIAHWPTRLVPVLCPRTESTFNYCVYIVKEKQEFLLDSTTQASWMKTIVEVRIRVQDLSDDVARFARSDLE